MKKIIVVLIGILTFSCSLDSDNNTSRDSTNESDSRNISSITEEFLEGSWLVYMYDVDQNDSDWYKQSTKRVYGDGTNDAHRIIFEKSRPLSGSYLLKSFPRVYEGYIRNESHYYNGSDYYEPGWIEPYHFLPRGTGVTSVNNLSYELWKNSSVISFLTPTTDPWSSYKYYYSFKITKIHNNKIKLYDYTNNRSPRYEINNKDKRFATQKLELFLYRDTEDGINGNTIVVPKFTDEVIREEVYKITNARPITISAVENLTELDLSGKGIKDLTGLKYFKNLEKLNLSNNNITDISELSSLRELKELDLSNNEIKDLSPLMETYNEYYPASSQRTNNNTGDYVNKFSYPDLTYLNVNGNNMEIYDYIIQSQANINWSGVLWNYQSKHLTHGLNIVKIDFEVGNKYATVLFNDPVLEKIIRRIILKTDPLDPIYKHDLVHIENLNFDSNTVKLTDLEGLQYCRNLKVLRIDKQEGITSLSPLYSKSSMLDKLEKIYAADCNITGFYAEIGNFKALNELKTLVVESNKLRFSDSNFDWCPNLEYLNWNNNGIRITQSEIPKGFFDKIVSLRHLSLSSNSIKHLDPELLFKLTELEKVYFYDNELTTVYDKLLSKNSKLKIINFGQNPLHTIDFLIKNSSSNDNSWYDSISKIVLDGSLSNITTEDIETLEILVKPTCQIIK